MSIQEQINQSVQALYVAFFDRAADAEGLAYWYNVAMDDGDDYIYQIADGFVSNPAFEDIYGGMNDEEFVKAIYLNVTNNDNIDADALAYWEGQVADNGRAHMVADFTQAVLSYDGTDADGQYRTAYLQAKVDAGLAFAGTLGDESNPTNPDNLSNDPAYIASQDIMSKFSTASDIAGVEAIKAEALDYIETHPTLGMWDNQAPTINPVDAVILDEDGEASGNVTASDVDNDYAGQTLTFLLGAAPANGTATVSADGTFNYTPYENFNGTDSFEVIVNDGEGGIDTAIVNVTVNPVNDAPVAEGASVITDEDNAIEIVATATDVDGDPLTYKVVAEAEHGTVVVNPNGTFTYTPNENYNGTDSFEYSVTDGELSDTATVDITVNAVNDAPVTSDVSVVTDEDTDGSGRVIATDVDGDVLTYTISNAPVNGDVVLDAATGAFTYTPYENYNGEDSFDVMVDDGNGGTAVSKVNLTVTPVNDAPVADNIAVMTGMDTPIDGTFEATDVDGDHLTFAVVAEAEHGTVTINPNGTFTYTPDHNYRGSDSFTYVANDGTGEDNALSNEALVAVDVNPTGCAFDLTSRPDDALAVVFNSIPAYTPGGNDLVNTLQDEDILTGDLQSIGADCPDTELNVVLGSENDNSEFMVAPTLVDVHNVNVIISDNAAGINFQKTQEVHSVNIDAITTLDAEVDMINMQESTTALSVANATTNGNVLFNYQEGQLEGTDDAVTLTLDGTRLDRLAIDQGDSSQHDNTEDEDFGFESVTVDVENRSTNLDELMIEANAMEDRYNGADQDVTFNVDANLEINQLIANGAETITINTAAGTRTEVSLDENQNDEGNFNRGLDLAQAEQGTPGEDDYKKAIQTSELNTMKITGDGVVILNGVTGDTTADYTEVIDSDLFIDASTMTSTLGIRVDNNVAADWGSRLESGTGSDEVITTDDTWMSIDTSDGDDIVNIRSNDSLYIGAFSNTNATIKTGAGSDIVEVYGRINADMDTSTSDTSANIDGVEDGDFVKAFGLNANLTTGAGVDEIILSYMGIDNAIVNTGSEGDILMVDGGGLSSNSEVYTEEGDDVVIFDAETKGIINTGNGDDFVEVRSNVSGDVNILTGANTGGIDLGTGADVLVVEGNLNAAVLAGSDAETDGLEEDNNSWDIVNIRGDLTGNASITTQAGNDHVNTGDLGVSNEDLVTDNKTTEYFLNGVVKPKDDGQVDDYDHTFAASIETGTGDDIVSVGDLMSGGQYNDKIIPDNLNTDDNIYIVGASVDTGAGNDTLAMGTVAENAKVYTGTGEDHVSVKMTDDAVMLAADGVYTIPKAGTQFDSEVTAGTNTIDYMGASVNLGSEDDTILFTDVNQTPNTDDTTLIVGQGALLDGSEGHDELTVETVDSVDVVDSKSIQDFNNVKVEGLVKGFETINLTFQNAISDNATASTEDGLEGISAETANDDYNNTQVGDGSGDASGTIRMDVAHVDSALEVVNLTSNEKRIKLDDTEIPAVPSESENEDGRDADSIDNGWVQGDTTRFDLENFRDDIEINLAAYEVTGLSSEKAEGASVMPNPVTDPTNPAFPATKVSGTTDEVIAANDLIPDNELANKGPRESLQDDCETDVTVTVNMDTNPDLDNDPIDTSFTVNLNANDNIVDPTDANYDVEIISVDTVLNANENDPSYYANNITVNVDDAASHAIELQDTFGSVDDRYYNVYYDNAFQHVIESETVPADNGLWTYTLNSDVRTSLTVNTEAAGEEILLKHVDADTITTTGASDIYLTVATENNYTITTGEGNDIINMKADTLTFDPNWTLDADGNHVMTSANNGTDLIDNNDYLNGGDGIDTLVIAGGQDIDANIIENNIRNIENIEINFDEYTTPADASDLVIDSSYIDRINITNNNEEEAGIADEFNNVTHVNSDEDEAVHTVDLDIYASQPVDAPHDTLIIDANIDTTCQMPDSCNLDKGSSVHSSDLILNIDAVDTDLDIRVNTAEGTAVNLLEVDQDEQVEITATVSSIFDTYVDAVNGGTLEGQLKITSETAALDKLILIDEKTYTDCVLDGGEVTYPYGPSLNVTVADEWADTALEIDASDIGNPLSDHAWLEYPTTGNDNWINGWNETDAELLIKATNDGDIIHSGQQDDVIFGDRGDDIIIAGEGYDVVDGGSGDDRIYGGLNGDTLTGEATDWINSESQDALEMVGPEGYERKAENTFVLGVKEVAEGDGTAQNAIDESNSGLDGRNADTITDFETGYDTLEINLGEVFNSDADNVVDLGTYAVVANPADGDDSLSGSATDPIVGDSYYSEEEGKHKFVMDVDGSGDITTNDITVMSEGVINAADLDIQMETGAGDDTIRLGQSVDRIDAGADDDTFVLVGAITEADQATYLADLHDNNVMNSIEDLGLGNVVDPNELITLRDQTEATAGDILTGGSGNDVLYVYGTADLSVMNISADIETLYVNSDVTLTVAQLNNFTTIEFGGSTEHAITIVGGTGDEFSDFDGYIVTNDSTVTLKGTSVGDVVVSGTAEMQAIVPGADVVTDSLDLPAVTINPVDDLNADDVTNPVDISGVSVENSEVTLTLSNGRDEDLVVKVHVDDTTAARDQDWSYDITTIPGFDEFVADFEGTVTVVAETMEGNDKVQTETTFKVDTVHPVMTDVDGSVAEYVDPVNGNVLTDAVVEDNTTGDLVFSESDVTVTKVVIGGTEYDSTTGFANMAGIYGSLAIAGDAANGYTYTYTPDKAVIDALVTGDEKLDEYSVTYEDALGNENTVTSTIDMDIIGADDIAEITGNIAGDVKEETALQATGTITVEDPDLNPDGTGPIIGQQEFVSNSTPAYGSFTYTQTDANGDSDWTYDLYNNNSAVQALGEGETLTDTITMTTADGTTEDITITITGTNDIPVIEVPVTATETGFTVTMSDVDANDTLSFYNASGSINGMAVNNGTPTDVTAVAQTTATTTNLQVTDGIAVVDLHTSFSEGSTLADSFGSSVNDRIIFAFDGDDTVAASDGDDYIVGGAGADSLSGGDGDDILFVDDADTVMDGGNGDDTVRLEENVNARPDTFTNNEHIEMLKTDGIHLQLSTTQIPLNDLQSVSGNTENGTALERLEVYKEADSDFTWDASTITFTDAAIKYSTQTFTGNDNIIGSTESDLFYFHDDLTNADTVNGNSGSLDTLYISNDNAQTDLDGVSNMDRIDIINDASDSDYKLSGNTLIAAGESLTIEHSGSGNHDLKLDISANTTDGELRFEGNDQVDEVTSGAGNDTLLGAGGQDILTGNEGDDTLDGGNDNDKLYGNDGEDTLEGGSGDDLLEGGNDNDTLKGDAGADDLYGDKGDDTIYVGDDSDIDTIHYVHGDGADAIYEFDSGEDQYDTDYGTTAGNYTFSGTYLADSNSALDLTTTSSEGVQFVGATIDGTDMTNTFDVVDLISNGTINIETSGDNFLLAIGGTDDQNVYLYEADDVSDVTIDGYELTFVGVFHDADLMDGDIV